MKTFLAVLFLATVIVACTTTSQYKTIAATEQAVLASNGAYLDSVVTGQTKTNDVPKVEAAFNATQLALHTAAALAAGGSSAPVPATVNAQVMDFTNLVNSVKGVK